MNMKFSQFLKYLREKRNINKSELAKKINVSSGYIINIESGKAKPPTKERLEDISKVLRLSEEEKSKLIELAFQERIVEKSPGWFDYVGTSLEKTVQKIDFKSENTLLIPLFGLVPAGGIDIFEEKPRWITLDKQFLKNHNIEDLFALTASGDCLKDAGLFDGDQVIVSKTAKVNNGDICIVRVDSEITCKKTSFVDNKIILETMNSDKNKKFIIDPKKKDVEIIGKVIRAIKNFE